MALGPQRMIDEPDIFRAAQLLLQRHGDGAALLPLGDGLGIDTVALGKRPQALLTMLYRSTDRLCRCGAAVKNLSHRASFHSLENNAPSNPGVKHLHRHYPASAVRRIYPPPQRRPACPSWASGRSSPTTPWGFPCCLRSPCVHAAANTPVWQPGVVFTHSARPYQPSPIWQSDRPTHRPFRGLLSVHSRCGLHTRAVTHSRLHMSRQPRRCQLPANVPSRTDRAKSATARPISWGLSSWMK
jgi:hypothetical protein